MKPTYKELEAERDKLMAKAEAMHLVLAMLAAKVDASDKQLTLALRQAESSVRELMMTSDGLASVRIAIGLDAPPPPPIDPERGEVTT
jgi:hypothetical protein